MTDDAVRQAEAAVQPEIALYNPFPTFQEWAETEYDLGALDRFTGQFDLLRAEVDPTVLEDAVGIATKWAAVNTGAIEGLFQVDRGFTYSVALSAAAWEGIHVSKGQFAADSIKDAIRAYDFVLDAATGAHPITEVWLRSLHETVVASQEKYTVVTEVGPQEQDLPKGEYKRYPNNPLNFEKHKVHAYAPPLDTSSEMARLIDELRSPQFEDAPAVVQAAYAHYAFVCIHPFADGNGRVSRALASTFLYRAIGVPLVVFADQKADYLDALEAADAGSPERFQRFISERVTDTILMVKDQIETATLPKLEDQVRELKPLLSGHGGLSHSEVDAVTLRFRAAFYAALDKVLNENQLPEPFNAETRVYQGGGGSVRIQGYRTVPGDGQYVSLQITSGSPAPVNTSAIFTALTRLPDTDEADFALARRDGTVILAADVRDLHPTISQAVVFRLETVATGQLRQLFAVASHMKQEALRQAGYL